MEMSYIRDFLVLAETGNFMEAADRLFISQSSLSKHIKSIEAELGASLFNRTTRKIKLSILGEIFLPYAKQIVHIQREYTTSFTNNLNLVRRKINIGSIPSMSQYNITSVIAKFSKSNPDFDLNIIQAGDELEEILRSNKCELAFIRQVIDVNDEFVKIPFAMDTLAAVLPNDHPLAKNKTVSLKQLKEENFLLLPKQTRPYNLCIRLCEQNNFHPKITFTDHKVDNIIDLVGNGMGVSLLMKKLALHSALSNVSIVDISPIVSTDIYLCYKKNAELSIGAKHFIDCILSLKRDISA